VLPCSTLTARAERWRTRFAPPLGTATGALLGGLLVQFLPAPTHLVYLALLVTFLLQGVGVVFMSETATRARGALSSLRPEFGVPPRTRRALLTAVPALVASWSLVGLYGALGPALVRRLSGSSSLLLGGLSLFALAGAGAVAVLVLRAVAPHTVDAASAPSAWWSGRQACCLPLRSPRPSVCSPALSSPVLGSVRPSRAQSASSCRWPRRTSGAGLLSVIYTVLLPSHGAYPLSSPDSSSSTMAGCSAQ